MTRIERRRLSRNRCYHRKRQELFDLCKRMGEWLQKKINK